MDKYLDDVHFSPGQRKWPEGIDWILPPAHVDTFDDQTLSDPLSQQISKKLTKYEERSMLVRTDDLVLLVFFSQGVRYNSPVATPHRRLDRLIEDVRQRFNEAHGQFSKAYVFMAASPCERVFHLW